MGSLRETLPNCTNLNYCFAALTTGFHFEIWPWTIKTKFCNRLSKYEVSYIFPLVYIFSKADLDLLLKNKYILIAQRRQAMTL